VVPHQRDFDGLMGGLSDETLLKLTPHFAYLIAISWEVTNNPRLEWNHAARLVWSM
jgi:hypothetical protein